MRKEILDNVLQSKILIGIRTVNEEWDQVLVGFITKVDEISLVLNEIDEDGFLIGNTIILLDNIVSFDLNDRYQKRVKFLNDNCSLLDRNKRTTIWKGGGELGDHLQLLTEIKEITTFFFDEDHYVTGYVLDFDENYILIQNVGREGDEDGTSCHLLNNIIGVRYGGIEEQKIKLLYENRNSFYVQ